MRHFWLAFYCACAAKPDLRRVSSKRLQADKTIRVSKCVTTVSDTCQIRNEIYSVISVVGLYLPCSCSVSNKGNQTCRYRSLCALGRTPALTGTPADQVSTFIIIDFRTS